MPEEFDSSTKTTAKKENSSDTLAGFVGILIFIAIGYAIWNWIAGDDSLYKKKSELQSEIITLAANGADLTDVKHHFSTAFHQEWSLFYRWNNDKSEHYRNDDTLLLVLKDIKNQIYLGKAEVESNLSSVGGLINEYETRNPFDGLESNQKDLFDNIRLKLGSEYDKVSPDILKLSDELIQKNSLVNQYLSDSRTSLYISIASLAFGVAIPMVGGVLKRRNSKRKLRFET